MLEKIQLNSAGPREVSATGNRIEEAFFNTPVFTAERYESLVQLLAIFAGHLSVHAHALNFENGHADPPASAEARRYIQDHAGDELSLTSVARIVRMSASYLSEKFKQATGMNFVEYVARTRIEKARHLLQDPERQISGIAFAVGFQSLSQFNRVSKKVTGQAPSAYREFFAAQGEQALGSKANRHPEVHRGP